MNEHEVRAYALAKGWSFVRVPALAFNGYWRDAEGRCFYAKRIEQMVKLEKKGKWPKGEKK